MWEIYGTEIIFWHRLDWYIEKTHYSETKIVVSPNLHSNELGVSCTVVALTSVFLKYPRNNRLGKPIIILVGQIRS